MTIQRDGQSPSTWRAKLGSAAVGGVVSGVVRLLAEALIRQFDHHL